MGYVGSPLSAIGQKRRFGGRSATSLATNYLAFVKLASNPDLAAR
jgi:hypothetical protein